MNVMNDDLTFSAVLINANFPTVDNNIYSMTILENLVQRFKQKPFVTIEELNLVERKLKNIPMSEPFTKRTMALVVDSKIEGNSLIITGKCKTTRNGKLLVDIINTYGIDNIDFYPLGYGIAGDDGIVKPDYKISYISFDIKNKHGVKK